MADSAAACFKKTVVKLRYIPPFRSDEDEPADCTTVKLMGQPNIVLPPPGWHDVRELRPKDEIFGIDLLCDVISTEGVGSIMLLLQVGTYIQFWVSFTSKRNKTVVELHQVYVAMPVIYKLPFTHIMFSRMMPTWMRIGHYIEAIMAGFGKIDEVEEALGKIDQLNRGVCPSDIMNFKKALQVIEDAATELIRRAARSGQEGDIVRLMTGKGPYPIRYAGMTDHSGRSIG